MLDLCCFAQALSICGEQGPFFIVVRGFLIVVASLAVELRPEVTRALVAAATISSLVGISLGFFFF